MANTRIDLITGFLGAGKTTLIARLLPQLTARGETFAVIENEFGAAGVDARRLEDAGVSVREISGGCVCCTQKVNFYEAMCELAGQVDRILIEPSGIFSPLDYLSMLRSPSLANVANPGFFVCVVDPATLDGLDGAPRQVLYEELSCAGGVILSHVDALPHDVVASAIGSLATLGFPASTVIATSWDDGLDLARMDRMTPVAPRFPLENRDHSTLFQSATLYPKETYTQEDALSRLKRLALGQAGDALRVKGSVRAQGGGCLQLDLAAGRCHVRTAAGGPAYLNLIGSALNRRALRALWP